LTAQIFLFRYDAGDHVAIYPTNDPELVEKIGQILNVDLDIVFSLVNKDGKLTQKSHLQSTNTKPAR
jgi:sulfite reductase alpha subunit-like flavoprotein